VITRILAMELRREQDVVLARQRARQVARLFGLDPQEQVRTATAVSEIARNAVRYAGQGLVEFSVQGGGAPALVVRVTDRGPGIRDLDHVLSGRYRSPTGLGLGLTGSRRLMDDLQVRTSERGTEVTLVKRLPRQASASPRHTATVVEQLAREAPPDSTDELQQVNQDLLRALDELRRRNEDLAQLNHELEDTNRGVVALYAELDEKAESLRRADQMKSRFLSHMSHEFRTPLNSILALTRLLEERADGDLTPEQEKQIGFIRRSAQDLTELVNDLLDLAKVEAGKTEVRPSAFDLGRLFGALRGLMRPLKVSPDVNLVFEEPAGIPELHTDEGKLGQILRNLVSNALKFTEHGEVRVSARLVAGEDDVTISVADSGIGIAPEDQQRIFHEFGQVEGPLQRRVKGTGLGLALSRKLAELLGGSLTVRSAVGQGSTFTLTIPRTHRAAPPAGPPVPAGAATPVPVEPVPHGRVLVIDDEESARYTLRARLSAMGLAVVEAADPVEGLRQAAAQEVDAVLLDLVMPQMLGFEVLERLREDPRTAALPVVVVTSKVLSPDEESSLAARGAAVLSKEDCARADAGARLEQALRHAGWAGRREAARP
jgi:signal transduction histidine kinase/CheY-like chemotaxis protein